MGLSLFVLAACSEKEQYTQLVHEKLLNDPDVKSYHLDVETMTECIVDLSSKKMPGFAAFEPDRKTAYLGYIKMLGLKKAEKPEVVLKELKELFGSARGLADAHRNYSESYLECMSTVTNRALDAKEEALAAE